MSETVALASEALSSTWRINVSGQVYGPYSGHQIKAFASEGRVAPHSIVQSDGGPWITAIDDPVLAQLFVKKEPPKQAAQTEAAGANFVVIADLRSRGSVPFEAAMTRMGEVYRLNSLVWLMHSDRTASAIRNELLQHMGQSDNLVVIDATHGRTAWSNLGPEVDTRIRRVWKRAADKANS